MSSMMPILSFYRDVETMEIPAAPKPARGRFPVTEFSSLNLGRLPWEGDRYGLTSKEATFHLVCFGVFDMRTLVEQVTRAIAADAPCDEELLMRLRGEGFLGTLLLDWRGRPVKGSLAPAPFVLGADRLSQGRDLKGLETENAERAQQIAEDHFGPATLPGDDPSRSSAAGAGLARASGGFDFEVHQEPITPNILVGISRGLAKRLGLSAEKITFRVMTRKVLRRRKRDLSPPDFSETLTPSFFIGDLGRVEKISESEEKISPPLLRLLGETPDERTDVLADPRALCRLAHPGALPMGRWPSSPDEHLSLAQQAAVCAAIDDRKPLVAINGPPGTGKTTLLRDVVAEAVVRRAMRLVDLEDPADLFQPMLTSNTSIPVIRPDIVEGTGVLVVSNNNSAVENISSELPRRAAIDWESFPEAQYLGKVADDVAEAFGEEEPDCWGLLALRLGNKTNIEASLRGLDQPYRGDEDDAPPAKGLFERLRGTARTDDWIKAREAFNEALQAARSLLQRPEDETEDERAPRLPDEEFFSQGFVSQQLSSLWVDPEMEKVRSGLFLAGLRLHEVALRLNAQELRRLVYPYKRVLSGQETVSSKQLVKVWNTLFFISPVISTALASVRRMPFEMGWIGQVLLDEAGQATPQSAVGVLQRAKRAVIVGDPLQIEPVFTVPGPVVERLRLKHGVEARFSPVAASAQTLADESVHEGAWVEASYSDEGRVWTGLPLRVHRRCAEPMFSVANRIAYGGQMVQAVRGVPSLEGDPGPSSWYDVRGSGAVNKVVPEEMGFFEEELRRLKDDWPMRGVVPASVFAISPFVAVASEAFQVTRRVFGREAMAACPTGTVHRFQGREADIVYLLLGSAPGPAGEGSRTWAAQRPNLLNVALTRARARVYVIGNAEDWSKQPYFSSLAQKMESDGVLRRVRWT